MESDQFNNGYGSEHPDNFNPNGLPGWSETEDPNIGFLKASFLDYNSDFPDENLDLLTGMTYLNYLQSENGLV